MKERDLSSQTTTDEPPAGLSHLPVSLTQVANTPGEGLSVLYPVPTHTAPLTALLLLIAIGGLLYVRLLPLCGPTVGPVLLLLLLLRLHLHRHSLRQLVTNSI
jgi:hypothetical protein